MSTYTAETIVYLPGNISANREPWVGTIHDALYYDLDRGMAHARERGLLPTLGEDEDDSTTIDDLIAVIDVDLLRDATDDPNAQIAEVTARDALEEFARAVLADERPELDGDPADMDQYTEYTRDKLLPLIYWTSDDCLIAEVWAGATSHAPDEIVDSATLGALGLSDEERARVIDYARRAATEDD